FPHAQAWYDRVGPGETVLLAAGYRNPGGNGSPRKQLHDYVNGRFETVVVGRITGSVRRSEAPHWPDELSARTVLYPQRFPFTPLFAARDVELASLPREVADAFRLSAIRQAK